MECERKNAWFRACKFEARHDIGAYDGKLGLLTLKGQSLASVIESTKSQTYVCDICTNCGKKIVR